MTAPTALLLAAALALAGCAQIRESVRDGYNAVNPPPTSIADCRRKLTGYEKCLARGCRINPSFAARCGSLHITAARTNARNDWINRERIAAQAEQQRRDDEQAHRERMEALAAEQVAATEALVTVIADVARELEAAAEEIPGDARGYGGYEGIPGKPDVNWNYCNLCGVLPNRGGPTIPPGEGGGVGGGR